MDLLHALAPLGLCDPWSPPPLWAALGSGAAIGVVYFALPIAVTVFATKRGDLRGSWALLWGSGFLIATGAAQVLSSCGAQETAAAITVALSLFAVLLVLPLLPDASAYGPAQLAAANERLRAEIASRVIAESELKRHAKELEAARDAANSASRAKGEFLANMSHEIRTPLNAVIGLTENLLGTELTDYQRENVETVLGSGSQLLAVINDILDFSKIEARKLKLDRIEFDLDDAVGDTLRSFAGEAARKGTELVCDVAGDVPRALIGDPGRLRQVLTNLVANAVSFTEGGQIAVRVWREPTEHRLELGFGVEDSGVGIEPDQIARLFESFEQADNSATRRHGGTGLGLSICRGLVQLLGGQLDATSSPGRGSHFFFTVRFDAQPEPAAEPGVPERLRGTRVLVVDDNDASRDVICAILRRHGLEPLPAASGAAALAALDAGLGRGEWIPLILADAQMPDLDGFALAERVRARRELEAVEIAILSSAGSASDARRCEELFLPIRVTKPTKEYELVEAVCAGLGATAEGARAEHLSAAADAPAETPDGARSLRILLAEDSIPNQKVALSILEGQGHSVAVAGDGQEAIGILASRDFDVVLMDLQMPLMDGFECTAAIRAAEAGGHRHLPIVAMTAHALQGDREKCLASGMDDYVSKPIRREELFRALSRVAPRQRSHVTWSEALSRVDGNRALLCELAESHLDELRVHVARLPEAIADGDWPSARLAARAVKDAMWTFGAREAVDLAQQLERLASGGGGGQARVLFERLERAAKAVDAELARFVETGRTEEG